MTQTIGHAHGVGQCSAQGSQLDHSDIGTGTQAEAQHLLVLVASLLPVMQDSDPSCVAT